MNPVDAYIFKFSINCIKYITLTMMVNVFGGAEGKGQAFTYTVEGVCLDDNRYDFV